MKLCKLYSVLTVLFLPALMQSQTLNKILPQEGVQIFRQAQYFIHNAQFQDAESLLVASTCPGEIKNFLNQVLFFWRFTYTKNDSFANKSIQYGQMNKELLKNRNDQSGLFFLAGTQGYLGLTYASKKDGSITSAMSEGRDGFHGLSDLLDKYPDFSECHLGLGIYKGMVSQLPTFLKWILYPFGIKGDRESAFNSLDTASKNEMLTKADAWFWKAAFLKEDTLAYSIYDSLTINYPKNPFYHSLYGHILYKNGQLTKAILELNEAARLLENNIFPIVKERALTDLGHVYYNLKEYDNSLRYWHQLEGNQNNFSSSQKREVYQYLMKNYQALNDTSNAEKYTELYENNH